MATPEQAARPDAGRDRPTTAPWRYAVAGLLVLAPVFGLPFTAWGGVTGLVLMAMIGALNAALVSGRAVLWTAVATAGFALLGLLLTATGAALPLLGTAYVVLLALATSAVYPLGLVGVGVVQILLVAHLLIDPSTLDASLGSSGSTIHASLVLAAVLFGSCGWVFLVRLALVPGLHDVPRTERNLPYGTLLAVLCGVFTFVCLVWFRNTTMWWTVLTIALVLQPAAHDTRAKAVHRVVGTLVGAAVSALAVAVIPSATVVLVLGLAAAIATVALTLTGAPYWQYATALTVTVMLLSFNPSGMISGDVQRILCTGLAALVTVLAVLVAERLQRRPAVT